MSIKEYRELAKKQSNKYGAKKSYCQAGHLHDSTKEANRCNELCLLQRAGKINNLEFQKPFLIIPALYKTVVLDEVYKVGEHKGERKTKQVCIEQAAYYVADFVYYDNALEKTVIEDSKGKRTKDYILKRKLVLKEYCQDDNTIFIET